MPRFNVIKNKIIILFYFIFIFHIEILIAIFKLYHKFERPLNKSASWRMLQPCF